MTEKMELTQTERVKIEGSINNFGFADYNWIDPKKIVVSQWVRMKCMFGCRQYARCACCPPNVPSVEECRAFFREYHNALIFQFRKRVEKPGDQNGWGLKVDQELLKLEREVFLSGYERAFLLFMESCALCNECVDNRNQCQNPRMARPTPEAMAVDVYTTVRQVGFPIAVLPDYHSEMNRYAFLMVR